MSDETKGATNVTNGCDHKEIKAVPELPGSNFKVCVYCAVPIHVETWMALHMPAPPPEPLKSWVERTAERSIDPVAFRAFARETAEECCRVLNADGRHGGAEYLRHAMLEPKA